MFIKKQYFSAAAPKVLSLHADPKRLYIDGQVQYHPERLQRFYRNLPIRWPFPIIWSLYPSVGLRTQQWTVKWEKHHAEVLQQSYLNILSKYIRNLLSVQQFGVTNFFGVSWRHVPYFYIFLKLTNVLALTYGTKGWSSTLLTMCTIVSFLR